MNRAVIANGSNILIIKYYDVPIDIVYISTRNYRNAKLLGIHFMK